MNESEKPSNTSESAMTIFMVFVPIVLVTMLLEMKHDSLRSIHRSHGDMSGTAIDWDGDYDDDDEYME